MNTTETNLKPFYNLGLSKENTGFLGWLEKQEQVLEQYSVRGCNYGLSESQETKYAAECQATIKHIEASLPKLVGLVKINGDPRGAAIKIDPYQDTDEHDTQHGCHPNPKVVELIRESGIARDWGGYGMLAPQHN